MQLKVIGKDRIYKLCELKIGDLILCQGNVFLPIKSILVISSYGKMIRLSNRTKFKASPNLRVLTDKGIKKPEAYDIIPISKELTPQIMDCKKNRRISFFYDILIDGNIISSDGIIFRYGD